MLYGCLGVKNYTVKKDYVEAEKEFNRLKKQWKAEQPRWSSNTGDYWETPAGKKIISMEKKALPFIMEEICRGNFFFNVPAEKITNISFRSRNTIKSEQHYAKKWAEWWGKNRNNPKWNIYLNSYKK